MRLMHDEADRGARDAPNWLDDPKRHGQNSQMRTATVTEAKNGLSALIDRVRAGETIVILDRGVPVARLEPVTTQPDPTGRIKRLERAGLIRARTTPPPVALLSTPGPTLTGDASVVDAVLEERRSGW